MNSIFLKIFNKIYIFLKNSCKHSILVMQSYKIDNFFKSSALNSLAAKVFIGTEEKSYLYNSKLYLITTKLINKSGQYLSILRIWILNSKVYIIFKEIVTSSVNNPIKIVLLFVIAFLISNISFKTIMGSAGFSSLIIELILLVLFIAIIRFNFNIKQLISESRFAKIFGWIVNHEI